VDAPDRVYKSELGKFQAVVREIKERRAKGQPVLVGTASIEKNEILGELLRRENIPFNLLNAKNHEKEAEFIAQAGRRGAVTVATYLRVTFPLVHALNIKWTSKLTIIVFDPCLDILLAPRRIVRLHQRA
jgi:hypothetical protein